MLCFGGFSRPKLYGVAEVNLPLHIVKFVCAGVCVCGRNLSTIIINGFRLDACTVDRGRRAHVCATNIQTNDDEKKNNKMKKKNQRRERVDNILHRQPITQRCVDAMRILRREWIQVVHCLLFHWESLFFCSSSSNWLRATVTIYIRRIRCSAFDSQLNANPLATNFRCAIFVSGHRVTISEEFRVLIGFVPWPHAKIYTSAPMIQLPSPFALID